jgi:maleylpyruvate isomerase
MSTPATIEARIAAADDACVLVVGSVTTLTDEQARGASRLPGWTRGHVLTHLARNADGLRVMVEGAIAGEEREQYPGGATGRAAEIDAGADRDAASLVADLETSQRALVDAWYRMPDDAWSRTGLWLVGGSRPIDHTLRARRRELLVHWVDLGLDATPADLSDDFLVAEDDWLREIRTTETWPDAPW